MAKDTFFVQSGSLYIIQGDNFKPSSSISFSFEDPATDLDSSDGAFASGSVNAGITRSHIITSFHPELSASGILEIDPNDPNSFYMSGSSPSASFYLSSSGRMGLGTTDPLTDVDIRATEFQIQKQGVRQGVKVNKEGNLESFNAETTAAATGSEFILSYTRGGTSLITSENLQLILGVDANEIDAVGGATIFFNEVLSPRDQDKVLFLLENPEEAGLSEKFLSSANVGDVLGSIRWIAKSGSEDTVDQRTAGEAATIQAVVNASSQFGTSADLLFKVADRVALEAATEDLPADAATPKIALRLDGNYQHQMTGSLVITSDLTIGGSLIHDGDTDTKIAFGTNQILFYAANASFPKLSISNTGVVINENGASYDFRVEGNTDAHLLFADASTNKVAIGTNTVGNSLLTVDGNIEATHITASGTIVANKMIVTEITSSRITSSVIVTSGSNLFGDTSGDTHTFIGSITASGNISASGNLIANNLIVSTAVTADRLVSTGNTAFGNAVTDTHTFTGHITASANISSSGTITALSSNIVTINGGSF